jgi:hypothetical protein
MHPPGAKISEFISFSVLKTVKTDFFKKPLLLQEAGYTEQGLKILCIFNTPQNTSSIGISISKDYI